MPGLGGLWGGPAAPQGLTFFKAVQLGARVLPHRGCLSPPFLCVLPRGKEVLESPLLLLQVSWGAQKWPGRVRGAPPARCRGPGLCRPRPFSPGGT